MVKRFHEIRDPIHNFIHVNNNEREILDTEFFQRLRYITQLATTYLLYPGATHKRFEHSLGVMELASKVFDVVTNDDNLDSECQKTIREIFKTEDKAYWRKVIRIAALCHDTGHFPFSHASEELLPEKKTHESITLDIILNSELSDIIKNKLKIQPEDVAKAALSAKDYAKENKNVSYSNIEAIMSEIITGDEFGADRMDYLLRDSYHAGVAYGKFDQYRLIETIRILPKLDKDSLEPVLGIEKGGIHTAEAFSLARYYMFSQLYFHPVRRVYDLHLVDFLKEWLTDGKFKVDLKSHLSMTDNEVMSAMLKASKDSSKPGHEAAKRIIYRNHFKKVYQVTKKDIQKNIDSLEILYNNLCETFGKENIKKDNIKKRGKAVDFPVLSDDNKIDSSIEISDILKNTPDLITNYIFVKSDIKDGVKDYLETNKDTILENTKLSESQEDKNI